jgi:hypothetical protein
MRLYLKRQNRNKRSGVNAQEVECEALSVILIEIKTNKQKIPTNQKLKKVCIPFTS